MSKEVEDGQFGIENKAQHIPLKRVLLKIGLINEALFAKHISDTPPIKDLANRGCFDEWWAVEQVAAELKLEAIKFDTKRSEHALQLITQSPCKTVKLTEWREMRAIPIAQSDNTVTLCMADPLDFELQRKLEFLLGYKIQAAIALEDEIVELITDKIEGRSGLNFDELITKGEPLPLRQTGIPTGQRLETNITGDDLSESAVIKLVNRILSGSIGLGASDIHITPEATRLSVRVRVDGILKDLVDAPQALIDPVTARIKILCGMDITERRHPQDARLRLTTNSGDRDLRLSTVPTAFGEDIVIRVLSSELDNLSLDTLGMPEQVQARFCRMLKGSSKVHLVTGPTGSGKTSTLYGGLLYVRDGSHRLMTIEDPIEYRLTGVSQIQVNAKVGMSFASALRSILRQDPDVILVGEIRDQETASTVMQVAQTGHLVLSTLHTNSAPAAITRLIDLGLEPFLIASSLGSITAQRLVRRLCPSCTIESKDKRNERFGVSAPKSSTGCEVCHGAGFKGRIGIYSFLEITSDIVTAIREGASEAEIEKLAKQNGFQTLEEAGLELVRAGVTSLAELERVLGPLENEVVHKPSAEFKGIERRKLLLVDDDDDLRILFNMVFEAQMFDVTQAADGYEALSKIYQNKPDVIVLDYMMPKLSGLDVIERLRSDPRTRDIPVLMLTASGSDELEVNLLKRGADDFVSKTARTEVITARINRLINR